MFFKRHNEGIGAGPVTTDYMMKMMEMMEMMYKMEMRPRPRLGGTPRCRCILSWGHSRMWQGTSIKDSLEHTSGLNTRVGWCRVTAHTSGRSIYVDYSGYPDLRAPRIRAFGT